MSGHPRTVPASTLAVGLGAVIALQSRVNGELSHHVGTGLFPAWLTMVTGCVFLVLIVRFHRTSRRGLGEVISQARARVLPWWVFTGGLFGSLFLVTQSVTVPLIGVAAFTVGIVAGQTTGSLVVDRLGLTGTGHRAITWQRVAASVIAIAAVIVGVSDRLLTASGTLGLALLAVLAGALFAPQQAFNGRVGRAAGSPFVGALGNFVGGVLVMSTVLGLALTIGGLQVQDPLGAPWWAYIGGLLGFTAIAGAAAVVPVLGVLLYSLLSLLGQLVGALLLDLLAPTPGTSLGWHLLVGTIMTFLAILVAAAPSRRQVGP
jgi:bacterial/archaeal transporter family-2 protein